MVGVPVKKSEAARGLDVRLSRISSVMVTSYLGMPYELITI